jgi:hypothetical protein
MNSGMKRLWPHSPEQILFAVVLAVLLLLTLGLWLADQRHKFDGPSRLFESPATPAQP